MSDQSHDQRTTFRRPARRAAKISFGSGEPWMNCRIWDISEAGARLAVTLSLANLPHRFTLSLFKNESVMRDCEVVWTDKRFVAVKFTGRSP
jgi:hypothetical protein